jgi:predicted nucleotidyltransferase
MDTCLDRDSILQTLEENADDLRRLGVRRLALFGSFLHGVSGPASDIDLLVDFDHPTFDAYMDTKFLLEDLLGRKVDQVTEKALKPALRNVRNEALHAAGF